MALANRSQDILVKHIHLLRVAFSKTRQEHPFHIQAIVVLPDHLHTIWTLPPNDCDYSTRWKKIKSHFSRCLPKNEQVSQSRRKRGERGIWQRRFWEHVIRDEEDYGAHFDYIHYNPVKHGLCERANDWPYSTFSGYVKAGIYPENWVDKSQTEFAAGE